MTAAENTSARACTDLVSNPRRTWIMGVLNCTPDSFYDGGFHPTREALIDHARRMIDEGADIIDVGGESTRPASLPVEAAEQIRRTRPVIEALRGFWSGPVSIDTTRAAVAEAAMEAGADWINDISALRDDPGMVNVAAASGCMLVLMHMQGTPRTMQAAPSYRDVVNEVRAFLDERAAWACAKGVDRNRIVIDPGIGFGKRLEDNLAILRDLSTLADLGYPVLVGASRKSFIGALTGGQPAERLEGSLAAASWAALHGARILRVHDVGATRRALAVARAIAASPPPTAATVSE